MNEPLGDPQMGLRRVGPQGKSRAEDLGASVRRPDGQGLIGRTFGGVERQETAPQFQGFVAVRVVEDER